MKKRKLFFAAFLLPHYEQPHILFTVEYDEKNADATAGQGEYTNRLVLHIR